MLRISRRHWGRSSASRERRSGAGPVGQRRLVGLTVQHVPPWRLATLPPLPPARFVVWCYCAFRPRVSWPFIKCVVSGKQGGSNGIDFKPVHTFFRYVVATTSCADGLRDSSPPRVQWYVLTRQARCGLVGLTLQHDLQPDGLRSSDAHAVLFLATPARGVPVLQVPGRCTPVDTLGGIENRLSDTRLEGCSAKGEKGSQGRAKTGADGRS